MVRDYNDVECSRPLHQGGVGGDDEGIERG